MAAEMNTLWGGFTIWESMTTANVPTLVKAAGVRAGQRVLDVGTGTGVAAITAARAGAHVAAVDPTPELLVQARENAHIAQTDVDFRETGAQAMPFRDDEFDVVLSHFGHIFAPNAQQAGDEMLRVLKPGGTLAFTRGRLTMAWAPSSSPSETSSRRRPQERAAPKSGGTRRLFASDWVTASATSFSSGTRCSVPPSARDTSASGWRKRGSGKMLVERLPPDLLAQVRAHIDENLARYFRDNIMHLPYLLVRATKA